MNKLPFLPRWMAAGLCILLISLTAGAAGPQFSIPAVGPASAPRGEYSASALNSGSPQRTIAAHVLRRVGFGPNPEEMATILQMGTAAYISHQLNPLSIDDSKLEARLPARPNLYYDYETWLHRWFIRMTYSRRQLREKMTLILHEHFANSLEKVSLACLMGQQEEFFRANALGNFRNLLVGITKDKAMLIYLDNNYNNGQATDDNGKRVPPNENYAREFLQLFTLGTSKLKIDGTPITDARGLPVPSYSEKDVREIARAFTGWYHDYKCQVGARFYEGYHDPGDKKVMGTSIPARAGKDGARDVDAVVDIVMRNPNIAPFISKILIGKLATETPTPGYVARVATVFQNTHGDLKATVGAILNDDEFYSNGVVLNMYKEPVEQLVGAIRGLEGETKGQNFIEMSYLAGQLPYFPPSVFSFYPPGQRVDLVNSALLMNRDRAADTIVYGTDDTSIDPAKLIKKYNLKTPEQVVDYLADALIAGPLQTEVRTKVIAYMKGRVTDEKFRGAAWLLLCSPDFSRN